MPHGETSFAISEQGKLKANQALETLVRDFDCVVAAILASPDGLLVAHHSLDHEIEADAVAAMSASIISLGDALTAQATHDENHVSKTVLSETEHISIVTLYAGPLILTTIGKAHANMGTVLSRTRHTAEEIAGIIDTDHGDATATKETLASFQFDPDVLLARVLGATKGKKE